MRLITVLFLLLPLLGHGATTAESPPPEAADKPLPGIAEATQDAEEHTGFVPLYFLPASGKVLALIEHFESDLLYLVSLPTGIGSNDIGLDRGQLSDTRLVFFRRSGPKVLLVERNLKFRAGSSNPGEQRAVSEAFATSILAGFEVAAESDGKVLIDVTGLLLSDAYGVGERLAAMEEGQYQVDPGRSAPDPAGLKAFERNSVMEAWITLVGDKPGAQLRSVVPTPKYLTVKMRHQFIALPEPGFELRPYHPRSGFFSQTYRDYAVPLNARVDQHLLVRHRLEKKQPSAARSEAVEPLVYYVDSGAPEPVRQALIDGASWWNEAFSAAGWVDAFRVEVLPADADPLDLRYNVIQWVHRETRGWSYGWGVIDPRSGEILKGHVTLGSLRVRQDMLIAEGLTAPFASGDSDLSERMALARLRQLAAHEVGHTLGLAHNFAASSSSDTSVMDYPHPDLQLGADGSVSLENAYATGMSAWDKLAISYGYRDYPSSEAARAGRAQLLSEAQNLGLRFISDPDVRGVQAAHAGAHLWDNGRDPLARFAELLEVRAVALSGFSGAVVRPGRPWAELERALVPVYLLHRYQAEAVAKLIGGVDYDYALRELDKGGVVEIDALIQHAALNALLGSLAPDQLALAPDLVRQMQPPAYGDARDRESFSHQTANAFDALAPARAATQIVTAMILDPARMQRVEQQNAALSVAQLLSSYSSQLIEPLGRIRRQDAMGLVTAEVAWIALRELQRLSLDSKASDPVRAATRNALNNIGKKLKRGTQAKQMAAEIRRFLADPDPESLPPRITVPPGSPI